MAASQAAMKTTTKTTTAKTPKAPLTEKEQRALWSKRANAVVTNLTRQIRKTEKLMRSSLSRSDAQRDAFNTVYTARCKALIAALEPRATSTENAIPNE